MIRTFFGAYDAGEYAATLANSWNDSNGAPYQKEDVLGYLSTADSENPLGDDNNVYYIVDEIGSIGFTSDAGQNIFWIFYGVGNQAPAQPAPQPQQPGYQQYPPQQQYPQQQPQQYPQQQYPQQQPQQQYPQQQYPQQQQPYAQQPQQQYPQQQYPQQQYPQQSPMGPGMGQQGMGGWSPRLNSPEFQAAINSNKKGSWVMSMIFSALPLVVCAVIGVIENSLVSYLLTGLGISVIFVIIFVVIRITQSKEKGWEGTVTEKFKKEHKIDKGNHGREEDMKWEKLQYTIVRGDDGKKHEIVEKDNSFARAYDYFQVGDRVRKHAGLGLGFPYEKFDKSKDTVIVCPFCRKVQPISSDHCVKCKKPLLK